MAAHRCFLFPGATRGAEQIVLDRRESHHLLRVLRAREGDPVTLLDGEGTVYRGRLAGRDDALAAIEVVDEVRYPRPQPDLGLVFSLTKGKTTELVLRMAAEIGVGGLQPVFSDHGEVRLAGDRLSGRLGKWRLTLVEACKQCGLPWLPALAEPVVLSEWLAADTREAGEMRVVASLQSGSRPLAEALSGPDAPASLLAAVGPEGDFSEREYGALSAAGFVPVRLGANVLRAETAAAYLLSVADQLLGPRA